VPPHPHANEAREPCGVPLHGQREKIDSCRTSAGRDADSAATSCGFRSHVVPIPQPCRVCDARRRSSRRPCCRWVRNGSALMPSVEKPFAAVKLEGRHLAPSLPRYAELTDTGACMGLCCSVVCSLVRRH